MKSYSWSETISDNGKPFKNDDKSFLFKLLSWHFSYVEKPLDKKAMVNFIIYDAIDWATNNEVQHILPYISRSKGNLAIGLGQLIKCSVRNIFLQKRCRKWGRI